jgi:hypothetical protein
MVESRKNVQFTTCRLGERGVRAVLNLNPSSSKSKYPFRAEVYTTAYNNDSGEFRVAMTSDIIMGDSLTLLSGIIRPLLSNNMIYSLSIVLCGHRKSHDEVAMLSSAATVLLNIHRAVMRHEKIKLCLANAYKQARRLVRCMDTTNQCIRCWQRTRKCSGIFRWIPKPLPRVSCAKAKAHYCRPLTEQTRNV